MDSNRRETKRVSTPTTSKPERHFGPRPNPWEQPVPVQLSWGESGCDGILLDLSETGLALRCAEALEPLPTELLTGSFSLPNHPEPLELTVRARYCEAQEDESFRLGLDLAFRHTSEANRIEPILRAYVFEKQRQEIRSQAS